MNELRGSGMIATQINFAKARPPSTDTQTPVEMCKRTPSWEAKAKRRAGE